MLRRLLHAFLVAMGCAVVLASVALGGEAVELGSAGGDRAPSGADGENASALAEEKPEPSTGQAKLYQPNVESYHVPELDLSGRVSVTLEEALRLAQEQGYQARVARATFDRSGFNVELARAAFDPTLATSLGYSYAERGGLSSLTFANYVSSNKSTFFNLNLSGHFPSGQDFSFTHSLTRNEVSTAGAQTTSIPTSYTGELKFSLSQPLGRGAGTSVNKWALQQARNSFALARFTLDETARGLRYQTYLQYYDLVAQRKALEVRRLNLSAAIKLLERNFERYKVGLAIRADVLQAENNVLNQKSRMIEAQRAYLDGLDALALLLGVSQPLDIAASVELEAPSLPLDQEDDWQMAREASAEIHQLETQLRNLEIERRFRRSELRPDVDLSVGYGRQGEDEAVGSAYRNLDNESYSLSLNYNLPWGKRAMKSRLAQVEDDLVACRASLEEANQKLRQEWEGLFREIESKRVQIVLNESSVGVAEENYRIQVERNRVGLASTLDVIQAQESLLEAQLSLLNAEVAYQHTYRQLLLMAGII